MCVPVRSDSDAFMVAAIEEENAAVADGQHSQTENIIACSAHHFESALTDAFNRTDEEFGKADNAALVGTTAVVALVGSRQLYVANCGVFLSAFCFTLLQSIPGAYFRNRGFGKVQADCLSLLDTN